MYTESPRQSDVLFSIVLAILATALVPSCIGPYLSLGQHRWRGEGSVLRGKTPISHKTLPSPMHWRGHSSVASRLRQNTVIQPTDGRILKVIHYGELVTGRRERGGRLQLRFNDICKRDLREINMDNEWSEDVAYDRSHRRRDLHRGLV